MMLTMHVYVTLSFSDYLFITGNVDLPPLTPYMLWLNSSNFSNNLLLMYNMHRCLRHAFLGQNCAYYMRDFMLIYWPCISYWCFWLRNSLADLMKTEYSNYVQSTTHLPQLGWTRQCVWTVWTNMQMTQFGCHCLFCISCQLFIFKILWSKVW